MRKIIFPAVLPGWWLKPIPRLIPKGWPTQINLTLENYDMPGRFSYPYYCMYNLPYIRITIWWSETCIRAIGGNDISPSEAYFASSSLPWGNPDNKQSSRDMNALIPLLGDSQKALMTFKARVTSCLNTWEWGFNNVVSDRLNLNSLSGLSTSRSFGERPTRKKCPL